MQPLTGRRALVCGSTQGIGRASAEAIASLGAEVVLLARDPERLRAVREQLPAAEGVRHDVLAADFSAPDTVRAVVIRYLEAHPGFEILVNNTGGPPAGPIFEATEAAFRAAFDMHLLCNHVLVQALVPGMKAKGYGRIINIISTSVREPIRGLGVSNTTRGAVASWAKTLSKELGGFGITVNNVLPGYTRTARLDQVLGDKARAAGQPLEAIERAILADIPLGRFAAPEELGAVVAFLASPAAGYVSGVSLPVDGGRLGAL
ncbi:MAG TPA: SDR family oxidoreductase [Gemmatimonadales bacterium]|nr:SDR family oxidoreductase [Gemmatimonadales bacterium]